MFCSKRCVVAPLRETFFLHPHRAAVESGKDFFSRNVATTQRKSGSDEDNVSNGLSKAALHSLPLS